MSDPKYRVLFLSEDFPPETNAAATRVCERALYWKKWGIDVEFITSFPNKFQGKKHVGYSDDLYRVDYIEDIKTVRVKTFITTSQSVLLRSVHQVSYMVASFVAGLFVKKPDVIISTTPQFFCGISGLILSKLRRAPFILEVADIWTDSIKGTGVASGVMYNLLRKIEDYIYHRSNAIIVLTNNFRDELIRRKIYENKIFVIRNGVNRNLFKNTGKKESVLDDYDIKGKKIIGYIGSIGSAQGLLNVVEAAKIMSDKYIDDVIFMFVGEGGEKEKLLGESDGLDNVIFVSGRPREEVPAYLSMCDIGLVHLKDHDVFKKVIPSKIFEIMAVGIPIILVSPYGEAATIIEENDVGKWIQSGDPKLLANTILDMIGDNKAMSEYSKNSLDSIDNFTREKQSMKVLYVVEMILDR